MCLLATDEIQSAWSVNKLLLSHVRTRSKESERFRKAVQYMQNALNDAIDVHVSDNECVRIEMNWAE